MSAIATGANMILIHCGINDAATPRTWADVETDLNTILVAVNAANPKPRIFLDEITPSTSASNTIAGNIRTVFNPGLTTFAATNGWKLVTYHDAFGKIRAGIGQLDDLLTAYNYDGTHYTQAGINAMAAI